MISKVLWLKYLSDFLEFIRYKVCISCLFLAISGYLLRNSPSIDILFLSLSSFFLCAGVYAYNSITDKEEDVINKEKISSLVLSKKGYVLVGVFIFIGLLFSLFLPVYSLFFAVMATASGVTYSYFRLKRYLLLKNVYTGFGVNLIFLMGATAGVFVTSEILSYYLLISIFILIGSVISDLRDYEGDKALNIKTLPVRLGHNKTKYLVTFLLAVYTISLLFFTKVIILLPFSILMFFAVRSDKPSLAHSLSVYSLFSLAFWLVL